MCLAIPGRIKSITPFIEGQMRTGKVDIAGITKEINMELVPEAKVDDYVLIHVGVALSIVDEEEANRTLAYLQQMNELDELYNSMDGEEAGDKEREIKKDKIIDKMIL